MPKKSHKKHTSPAVFLFALLLIATAAGADDYSDARAELVAAYQAQDFPAMRVAAQRSLDARPRYPNALFNLAFAQALDGDAEAAVATLNRLLEMKIVFPTAGMDEFAGVRELKGYEDYAAAVEELHGPYGSATVAYTHDVGDFVPEGIALGGNGELFLGSIHRGDIVRIGETTDTLATAADAGHWSVFGMRYDGAGTLWYLSSALDEFRDLDADDAGRNGLFAIDTDSGAVMVRAMLPGSGNKQVLGDLILVDDDTIFVADQADGVVYRYSISTNEFSILMPRGQLVSPQGLVLDESGDYLYVADYVGGLYRVNVENGNAEKVVPDDSASDYGIDGLYRYKNRLIAIQNGIRPNRVVEFTLSDDGTEITSSRILAMNLPEFDDPNLGQVVGDEFLFIANSHWPQFDREFRLPENLTGPIVLWLSLE